MPAADHGTLSGRDCMSASRAALSSRLFESVMARPTSVSATARNAWQDAMDAVDSQIAALQQVLRGSGDEDLEEIAEYGLNAVTGNHKVPLMAALMDIGTGTPSAEALARVHALKTGRLMACAVHIALVLAPPPPDQEALYRAFARELGLLFQIVDDILDVAGSEEALGKAVGTDERLGKATYVSLHGMDRARALAAQSHARCLELLGRVDGPVDDLAGIADTAFARQS